LKARCADLFVDWDVGRWFDDLAARSIVTATVYLRTLGLYCQLNGMDLNVIVRSAKNKTFRIGFTDFIRSMDVKVAKERQAGRELRSELGLVDDGSCDGGYLSILIVSYLFYFEHADIVVRALFEP
jgi:hypothetical protein